MNQLYDISLLIVNSNFWLILGIILIIFEVFFIGTMVFILPIGLASILNGIIFFTHHDILKLNYLRLNN